MTKQEVTAKVGAPTVDAIGYRHVVPTSRAYDHPVGEIEWSAAVDVDYNTLTPEQVDNLPIGGCQLVAYYYTNDHDARHVELMGGDWSVITWAVDHYEIV